MRFFTCAALLATVRGCATDDDCGLLGECISGGCACDAGWVGVSCTTLDLLPASADAGLRQRNSSNWCGTILRDEADAELFHSYNSDFNGCKDGLNIWLTGSRVIHSTARRNVEGPYTPVYAEGDMEVAISSEAHNPQAIRAPDGTYLLMDSYGGPDAHCNLEANYTTCGTVPGGGSCRPKMPSGGNGGRGWWVFHTSASPAGPWTPVNVTVDFPCFSENLTPSPAFHPNGTFYIVFHCDADEVHRMCDLSMVRGDSWRGPLVRVNDKVWDSSAVRPHPEDPFVFFRTSPRSGETSFHVVLHNTPRGIHLFSRNGLNFTLQQALGQAHGGSAEPVGPFVFNETIYLEDGSNFTAARRERPWILFDGNSSRPVALVTSMQAGAAWPQVFTHVQRIR
jgi:hypothetical protein